MAKRLSRAEDRGVLAAVGLLLSLRYQQSHRQKFWWHPGAGQSSIRFRHYFGTLVTFFVTLRSFLASYSNASSTQYVPYQIPRKLISSFRVTRKYAERRI